MIVWVCVIITTLANGTSYVLETRGPSAVIDNISTQKECERVGSFIAAAATNAGHPSGNYRCIAVRKAK